MELQEIPESIDITISQTELFEEVPVSTGVPEMEVRTIMDAFIQLYLGKLKLI